ncbi:MAG: hypothetical protein Q9M36_09375 [Sulfurovum sp.]|nr:hypothetical protein [Sulfurovum sp.]
MNINNIENILNDIMDINGAIATAVIDWKSGMALGVRSNGNFDIELASAGNAEVIKAKMATMQSLGLSGNIKDILITLDTQLHIITLVPNNEDLALYLALDGTKSNLALARAKLKVAVA